MSIQTIHTCDTCKKVTSDYTKEVGWITLESSTTSSEFVLKVFGARRLGKEFISLFRTFNRLEFCSIDCVITYFQKTLTRLTSDLVKQE